MRVAAFALLAALIAPAASLATPELPVIPNLGQSGRDVTLPDVVGAHYPPELPPGGPDLPSPEIPEPPAGDPPGGTPPEPVTPAGQDAHPLGGAPPFGLGNNPLPEPTAALLLGVGLGGLLLVGRQRRS